MTIRSDTTQTIVEVLRDGGMEMPTAIALIEEHVPLASRAALCLALEEWERGANFARDWNDAHIENLERLLSEHRAVREGDRLLAEAGHEAWDILQEAIRSAEPAAWCEFHPEIALDDGCCSDCEKECAQEDEINERRFGSFVDGCLAEGRDWRAAEFS